MNTLKKISIPGYLAVISAILGLVGLIVYIHSSTTGWYAGQDFSIYPIIISIVAIIAIAVAIALSNKLGDDLTAILIYVAIIAFAISACVLIYERQQAFADVYFIPVNHQPSEDVACTEAIIGVAAYLVSAVLLAISGISSKLTKN